jgi:hypothetical protein
MPKRRFSLAKRAGIPSNGTAVPHRASILLALAAATTTGLATPLVVTFEDVALATPYAGGGAYFNGGPTTNSAGWSSAGAHFTNSFTGPEVFGFSFWSGWAASSTTDATTAGFSNQYSAWPGGGAGGSPQYGILYGSSTPGSFAGSRITLPAGFDAPLSVQVANTTYAALSIRDGDVFTERFGGLSGDDPDSFILSIRGLDALGGALGTVDFVLADYRFADNSLDFIRSGWSTVDLSPLGPGVRFLEFAFTSSDVAFGFTNTPTYIALDNLTVIPEPSTWAVLAGAGAILLAVRRRRTS